MSNELIPAHTITHRREDLAWWLLRLDKKPNFGHMVLRHSDTIPSQFDFRTYKTIAAGTAEEYELWNEGRYFLKTMFPDPGADNIPETTWYEFVPRG